jgi:cell wall-associated NlpC family hydrolase
LSVPISHATVWRSAAPGRRRANDRGRLPISGHASDARLRPLRGFAVLVPILTVLFTVFLVAPALAVPQSIIDARGDLEALRSQVQQLNDRVETSVEDYNYAKVQLTDTDAALASTQKKLTRAEKDLVTAQSHMEQRIDGLYRDGRLGLLDALLGARTFNDLINRFDLLRRVGAKDQEVYAQVATYRADVSARKTTLAQDQAKQKKLLAQSKAALASVKQRLAERERALKGKEQQVAQLEAEEQARQARLAAQAKEAARQAVAAAAKARQQAATKTHSSGSSNGSSNGNGSAGADVPSGNVPSSQVGGSVIDIAMQFMGVPYVWGGASPSGFDCSGFVMYVFARAGVSLPHSSRAQFGYGVAVSRDALQPGDLVFFGSPIHHVGIYVGGGNMINAPYTGSSVHINSIDRSNFVGARRIL